MTLGKLAPKSEKPKTAQKTELPIKTEKMTVEDWAEHLFDSQIPLRAGALRELTNVAKKKLLDSKFYPVLKKSALESIKSSDPFLFLSGVEALATLALNDRALLTELMKLFQKMSVKNPTVALQFGEILARVCCQLGDMAASYAKDIIPILLSTASRKNVDPIIVASAISAAGSILPLTGFFLHDIQVCDQSAASFLAEKIISGRKKSFLAEKSFLDEKFLVQKIIFERRKFLWK